MKNDEIGTTSRRGRDNFYGARERLRRLTRRGRMRMRWNTSSICTYTHTHTLSLSPCEIERSRRTSPWLYAGHLKMVDLVPRTSAVGHRGAHSHDLGTTQRLHTATIRSGLLVISSSGGSGSRGRTSSKKVITCMDNDTGHLLLSLPSY